MISGLAFPVTGIGWIILVPATVLQSVPFGAIVARTFTIAAASSSAS